MKMGRIILPSCTDAYGFLQYFVLDSIGLRHPLQKEGASTLGKPSSLV